MFLTLKKIVKTLQSVPATEETLELGGGQEELTVLHQMQLLNMATQQREVTI